MKKVEKIMIQKKEKILIVTGGYLPGTKYGGITTSRKNFVDALSDWYNIAVVTGNHDFREKEPYANVVVGWNIVEGARVLYLDDKDCTEQIFSSIIEEENPTYIYASGTITSAFRFNMPLFRAARKKGISIVLTPDGDICEGALEIKRYKKMLAVLLCRTLHVFDGVHFQVTLEEERQNLIRYLKIRKEEICLVPNFPRKPLLRENYSKSEKILRVIFASRIQTQKNLLLAIEMVQNMKSEVFFDIYGPIENPAYWDECKKKIMTSKANVHIQYRGALMPADAASIYKNYDCFFLPTQSENYCYAIEESIACGCPVIISKGTTPWDDVEGIAGRAIPLSEQEQFTQVLEEIAQMSPKQYKQYTSKLGEYIQGKLNMEVLKEKYIEMLNHYKHGEVSEYESDFLA